MPPGHQAWRTLSLWVFSSLKIVATRGLMTPSTRPCDKPMARNATYSSVVPVLSKIDATGPEGRGARRTMRIPPM